MDESPPCKRVRREGEERGEEHTGEKERGEEHTGEKERGEENTGEERGEEHTGEERGEEHTGEDEKTRVHISMCGAAPLVWLAAEVRAARVSRVTGTLVGALARQPRQNGRLGRPLQLRPEEARLLLESRRAAVVGSGSSNTLAQGEGGARELVERYEELLRRSFEEQSALALEDRRASLLQAMTAVKRGGAAAAEDVQARLEGLARSFSFPRSAMALQLNTARAGLAHGPGECSFLRALLPDGPHQEARFRVFQDLRRRGFYLTSAGKFGGDFLVYPGDPLRFHAHFIVVCVSLEERLSVWDVLAVARLGSSVKKTVLMCSLAAGRDTVLYTSLQWSGMV